MSKRLSKEDQRYQLSKTYTFKDLEVNLGHIVEQNKKLIIENKYLKDQNIELKQENLKYDKIFEGQK